MAYLAFHCRLFTTHGIWDIDVSVTVKFLVGMMRFGGDHLGFFVCLFVHSVGSRTSSHPHQPIVHILIVNIQPKRNRRTI